MEDFVNWIADKSWVANRELLSGHLIPLDKQPGICPVEVGETWRRLFAKIVINVTELEATMECHD